MSLVLQSNPGMDFAPHPEGIYPAVCVDVIDLGLVETEYQGQRRLVKKVRIFFETEQVNAEGKNYVLAKTFTASLHPKARLAEFLGKWRGRAVAPGESIDLDRLIGVNCTLVLSQVGLPNGRTYAAIDAISKPTRKIAPSGKYDPVEARQRIAEARLRNGGTRTGSPGASRPAMTVAPERGNAPSEPSQATAPSQPPRPAEEDDIGF